MTEKILESNTPLVKIHENPEMTVQQVESKMTFSLPKSEDLLNQYLKDARDLLDRVSFVLSPSGIHSLIGAMIYVTMVENYHGKDNA